LIWRCIQWKRNSKGIRGAFQNGNLLHEESNYLQFGVTFIMKMKSMRNFLSRTFMKR